jgi:divalent metal cation (Fe/Co/Zn/Cd) transporter
VLAGLILVYWTNWLWLDGAVACIVGLNILITGGKLLFQSSARLLDASDPQLLNRIADLINKQRRTDWVDIHQLRAWRAGYLIHIDLHLVLPQNLSLEKAHQEAKRLEHILVEAFHGNASVLVHMDPCAPVKCPICGRPDCDMRSERHRLSPNWNRQRLTRASSELNHNGEQF